MVTLELKTLNIYVFDHYILMSDRSGTHKCRYEDVTLGYERSETEYDEDSFSGIAHTYHNGKKIRTTTNKPSHPILNFMMNTFKLNITIPTKGLVVQYTQRDPNGTIVQTTHSRFPNIYNKPTYRIKVKDIQRLLAHSK